MATTRFGHLDDFTLKNSKVGIGTSDPTEALEVIGGSRTKDIAVTGIATLTSYEGFQNTKTSYADNVNITSGESGTLSGEVVIGTGLTMSVGTGATTGQGSIKSLKVSNTFNPPIGRTNDRPSAPQPGALYYNKDFRTIEYWDGNFWRQVDHTTTSTRCIWGGGYEISTTIDYVNGSSLGNAKDFGKLTSSGNKYAALDGVSSSTRGIFGGGYTPTLVKRVLYIEIQSSGISVDFGDKTDTRYAATAVSSFPAPAIAADRIEVNCVATWGRGYPGLGTGGEAVSQRISDLSDGRIVVNHYAGGERVGPLDVFTEVSSGNAQMYNSADYYWVGQHPGWGFFAAVPFLSLIHI